MALFGGYRCILILKQLKYVSGEIENGKAWSQERVALLLFSFNHSTKRAHHRCG
jgi:hypothetical protein